MRSVDAVAAVALQEIEVRREAADGGHAVDDDCDAPAPCEVDLRVGELRENLDHARPNGSTDIRRIAV